jgi:hypothetical protein
LSILAESQPWQKVGFCEWPVTDSAGNLPYRPIVEVHGYISFWRLIVVLQLPAARKSSILPFSHSDARCEYDFAITQQHLALILDHHLNGET